MSRPSLADRKHTAHISMSSYIHMNHIDICPYGNYYVKFACQHIYAFLFATDICIWLIPLWCMQMCLKPTSWTKLFYEQTYFIINFTTGPISMRFAMPFSISINFIEIEDNVFKMVMMAAILSMFWNTFAWQKPFVLLHTSRKYVLQHRTENIPPLA